MIEYHPFSAKDQSRLHQFGNEMLLGIFVRYALYAGRVWKGDILNADSGKLEIYLGQKCMFEHSMRLKSSCRKMVNKSYSRPQMDQSNGLEEVKVFRKSTLMLDYHARRDEHKDDFQGGIGRVSTDRHNDGGH